VLDETLAKQYPNPRPLVLAISGDETQHVLWRMHLGGGQELGSPLNLRMANDTNLLVSLLIGTNNLGNAKHSPLDTANGIYAIAKVGTPAASLAPPPWTSHLIPMAYAVLPSPTYL